MRHEDAYKISVVLSVLGLVMMYGASVHIQIQEVNIGEIKSSWQGKNVIAEGKAVNVTRSGGHLFFDLTEKKNSILVVDFNSNTDLEEGDTVEATGKVEVYEGELEIIAEELRITD